jgi:hypothetical protein
MLWHGSSCAAAGQVTAARYLYSSSNSPTNRPAVGHKANLCSDIAAAAAADIMILDPHSLVCHTLRLLSHTSTCTCTYCAIRQHLLLLLLADELC